jgi:prepilin-type N-terminal cleavage/methylation domain-containing protein/prepilin-type processing-associated H-X9-DG protein
MHSPTLFSSSLARDPRASRSGFTLVELLVVITIIVVLAAASMVAIPRFRSQAKQSKSMGNLKQFAILNQIYSSENNGRFVPGKSMDAEGKKKEWYCHLAASVVPGTDLAGPWSFFNFNPFKMKPELDFFGIPNAFPEHVAGGYWNFGYGLNMMPGLPTSQKQNTEEGWGGNFQMDTITDQSRRMMIAEWPAWNMYGGTLAEVKKNASFQGKKLQVLFFDGHCESLEPARFVKAFNMR